MALVQNLERKRAELQEHYNELSEKIKRFRPALAAKADEAVRFQLEKDIEQAEAERSQVEQQLALIDSQRLYNALLRLNYQQQVLSFKKLIQDHRVAAFLIHGEPEYGQRWLLNRLAQNIPYNTVSKVICGKLTRRGRGIDINALWRELGGRVGLGSRSCPTEIAEHVSKCWQTQNVILVFHDVDFIAENAVHELIREFWAPLALKAKTHCSDYRLLMFLIDYQGDIGKLNLFADHPDPNWNPETPIRLPTIARFSFDILNNWISNAIDELPAKVMDQLDSIINCVLQESENGIPERVLRSFCEQCGYENLWYEGVDRWLKL